MPESSADWAYSRLRIRRDELVPPVSIDSITKQIPLLNLFIKASSCSLELHLGEALNQVLNGLSHEAVTAQLHKGLSHWVSVVTEADDRS